MTDFATFAQSELSDLDVNPEFITDEQRSLIVRRRDDFIDRQLDEIGVTNTSARSIARRTLEQRIPSPRDNDPRFMGALTALGAQQRANQIAEAPLTDAPLPTAQPQTIEQVIEERSAAIARSNNRGFIERAVDTGQTLVATAIGSTVQGAGATGEFLTGGLIARDLFEGIQNFGADFSNNNIPEATRIARERNAQIGQASGAGAQITDFLSSPELIADPVSYTHLTLPTILLV